MNINSNRLLLFHILEEYSRFVFYDAVESLIDKRNLGNIFSFFNVIYLLLRMDADKKELPPESGEKVKSKLKVILSQYHESTEYVELFLQNKSLKTFISDDFRGLLGNHDIIDDILMYDYDGECILKALDCFFKNYDSLQRVVKGQYKEPLNEFHNAMTHFLAAIVYKTKFITAEQQDDEDTALRNVSKAISHLHRGAKDCMKIIIKSAYPVIKNYVADKNDFLNVFSEARCHEVCGLSDKRHRRDVEFKLSSICSNMLKKGYFKTNEEGLMLLQKNIQEFEVLK